MTATRTKRRILSVTIRRELDESPDTSWLGEYSNSAGPDDRTIDRKERGDMGRNECRFFIAANGPKETGGPESVEQDYRRLESFNAGQWCFVGVWIEAQVVLTGEMVQRIRSGGLWGIESDSGDYFAEVEKEEFAQLRAELTGLGFSKSTISRAFKAAERKE